MVWYLYKNVELQCSEPCLPDSIMHGTNNRTVGENIFSSSVVTYEYSYPATKIFLFISNISSLG